MKNIFIPLCFFGVTLQLQAQSISATTYPFTVQTGVAPEDMSSATTMLIGPGSDNGSTILQNIGFDFWFGGTRYTQYSASANGYIRLGTAVGNPGTSSDVTNSLASFNQAPCIAPYWDDIRTAASGGQVHSKVIGMAPDRKLVIEWLNMEIPKFETTQPRSFQLWMSESTGKIEFVYGRQDIGISLNTATSGASIGINRGGTTSFASISAVSATVSYTTANNTNTAAIAAGTKFMFTPTIPAAPTGLSFSDIGGFTMVLNWTDNATDETGYAIYRSEDGGTNYQFITQLAANATTYTPTLLQPNTLYHWKIAAVSYGGGFSTALQGMQATANFNSIGSNGTGGGNWSDPNTWEGGQIPKDITHVLIKDGDIVTIDVGANAYNLQVGQGNSGILQFEPVTARPLSVFKNLEIKPGATLQTGVSGAVTNHVLNVYENLLNNGVLDLAGNTTGTVLRFLGNMKSDFNGNGSTTDIYSITIQKASVNEVVEMALGNFSVRDLSENNPNGFLTISSGTCKISGTNAYSGVMGVSANIAIGTSAGFWLNNPNFTILGQNGMVGVSGALRISEGIFNAGAAIDNVLQIGGTGLLMEGGTLNVAGRCSTTVYIQTGGVVNICTIGNTTSQASFEMPSGNFTQTGGLMRLVKLNSFTWATDRKDYLCNPGSFTISGGKLQVGVAGSTTAVSGLYTFRMSGTTPTLEVIATNPTNAGITLFGNLVTRGAALINPNTRFTGDNFSWTLYDDTLTNNGTITILGVNRALTFTGTNKACVYRGNGIAGTGTTLLSNLVVDNSFGLVIDPLTANNLFVNNFQLALGNVTNAHKITIGNGSLACTITIGFAGSLKAPGTLDVAPVFNLGSGTLNLNYQLPSQNRTMGFEVGPTRVVTNFTLRNSGSSLKMSGGNLQVNGTLDMGSSKMDLNGDTLTLGSSTSATGTLLTNSGTVMHNGKLRRWIPNNSTAARGFPVGTTEGRRNATIAFSTLPTTGGTITVEYIAGGSGTNGLPLSEGNITINSTHDGGFWKINTGDGLADGVYTLSLTCEGLSGIADFTKLVLLKRSNGGANWLLEGTHVTTTGSNSNPILSRTGITGFGEYAIGMPGAALPQATTWTGAVSTAWEDAANWSNGVPGAITAVTIPGGMPRYPVLNSSTSIKGLNLAPDAILNVANGIVLHVTGN